MDEQRLIDAYKLIHAMYDRAFETDGDTMWQSGCWVRYRAVEQVIRAQPTIEERKKGEWKHISGGYVDIYECNQCGETEDYERNYCPNCGADMRGEENGTD